MVFFTHPVEHLTSHDRFTLANATSTACVPSFITEHLRVAAVHLKPGAVIDLPEDDAPCPWDSWTSQT